MRAMLAAWVLVLCAVPTGAQTPDNRWSPWLGCWELVTEGVRQDANVAQPADDVPPRICVTPTGNGARFETTVPGQPTVEYTIVPTGSDRPVDDTECRGTQRSEWSRDGQRLFGHATLTCASDRTPRQVSNLALLAPNGHWVDVQSVVVAGRESVRVRRYRRAGTGDIISAGTSAAVRLDLEDIKEATGKLSPLVLEVALVEINAGFNLTSKAVVDLASAGVGERVIDLMVALSYPDRFVIERTSREPMSLSKVGHSSALGWAYGYATWYDDFSFSPYYLSDVGPPYFVGGGGSGGGRPPSAQPTGGGRAVDGLGYTRVRPRDAEEVAPRRDGSGPTTLSTSSTSTSSTSSAPATSTESSSSSSSSSGSSGSAATPSGFTGGGSSDSGRTAVPR